MTDYDLSPLETRPPQASGFPGPQELVVTTDRCVSSWAITGVLELFRSTSAGILVAKRVGRDGQLLAVADAEVVVLHDLGQNSDSTYQLKKADGHLRLLCYDETSERLFFTTSLQNTVQSYALSNLTVLDPIQVHPSPPTCLAVSPTGHLLLSASAAPPVILLQRIRPYAPATQLRPRVSATAATAVAFHPQRLNIFAVAFGDGAIALYNTRLLFTDDHPERRKPGNSSTGRSGEIGLFVNAPERRARQKSAIQGSPATVATWHDCDGRPSSPIVAKGYMHITAVEFLPSHRARIVAAGLDGRCSIIEFNTSSTGGGRVVKNWHAHAAVQCLAVLPTKPSMEDDRHERGPAINGKQLTGDSLKVDHGDGATGSIIAVGRADGKAALYTTSGALLAKRKFDHEGRGVTGVDWSTSTARVSNGALKSVAGKETDTTEGHAKSSGLHPTGRNNSGLRKGSSQKRMSPNPLTGKATSESATKHASRQEVIENLDGQQSDWQDVADVSDTEPSTKSQGKQSERKGAHTRPPPSTTPGLTIPLMGGLTFLPESNPAGYRSLSAGKSPLSPKSLPPPTIPARPAPRRPSKPRVRAGSAARRLGSSSTVASSVNSFARHLANLPRLKTEGPEPSNTGPTGLGPNGSKQLQKGEDAAKTADPGGPSLEGVSPHRSSSEPKPPRTGQRRRRSTRRAPKVIPARHSSKKSSDWSSESKGTSSSMTRRSMSVDREIKNVRSGPAVVEQPRTLKYSVRPRVSKAPSSLSDVANSADPDAPPPSLTSSVVGRPPPLTNPPASTQAGSASEYSPGHVHDTNPPTAAISPASYIDPAIFDFLLQQSETIRSGQESIRNDISILRRDLTRQVEAQGQRMERSLSRYGTVMEQVVQDNDRLRNELAAVWQNFLNHIQDGRPISESGSHGTTQR